MELFLPIMRTSPLFAGMEEEEIRAILGCLDARVERYPKGAYLLRVGDTVESVGLLLADVELQSFKFIVRHNDYFLSSVKYYLWCLEHRGYIRPKRKFALTRVSK